MDRKAGNKLARSRLERQARKESDAFSGSPMRVSDPTGAAPEARRTPRVSVFYAVVDAPGLLGGVSARAGKDTLITDRAPRRLTMHEIFGTRNFYEMANVPSGEHKHLEAREEPLRVSK